MISSKTSEEIEIMREGGHKLANVMQELSIMIKPGISTQDLDRAAEALILRSGAKVAFKGYLDFPATLCTSVNEEVVHVIPSQRILKEGDIITLDLGLIFKGYYLDMARTFPVGKIGVEAERLLRVTKEALELGTKEAKLGNTLGDIGYAVQQNVESNGFGVVRELCGHGIGKQLHEAPQVLNVGKKHEGILLKESMVICIEPMVTLGDWHLKRASDDYGFQTKDGSLSCHFEDTIAITANGSEVLTKI